ncbi:MAG TPA: penicillin-binding transpeptidase domain-containing protein [Chlamydiales bacterium]|nr:penicillin-binding transpeptidase domain-containing protein [Chlamydiales bacterium]
MKRGLSLLSLFFIVVHGCLFTKETFLVIHGATGDPIYAVGDALDERVSPYSTFKIALSLIGYDMGILKDPEIPTWEFQVGYEAYLPAWETAQNPLSWMRHSCVWYSKILASQVGQEGLQKYLASFSYGNEDLSGGLVSPGPVDPAWIDSSLKISPKEQVTFLQKMIQGQFPVSQQALQMTKVLMFREELANHWQLYGKTGGGSSSDGLEYGWFVGWIEKGERRFPFAYLIRDQKIEFSQRAPRVKQFLEEAEILN